MKILYSFLLLAVCSASGFTQGKVIDKNEFDNAVRPATQVIAQYMIGKPFRMTVITEARNSLRPDLDYKSKWISETALDGSTRGVRESMLGKNGNTFEGITIGIDSYARKNGGGWEKLDPPKVDRPTTPTMPPPPSLSEVLSSETEYKYLGTETFKGETARTYLQTERRTEIDKVKGTERKNETTTKYWLALDGHMLKSDFLYTTKNGDAVATTKVTIEYEIDPSITIIAPTIAAAAPAKAN
jgi:hypothetical protein